jgi:hypothetical protein
VEDPGSHAHAIRTAGASFVTCLPPRRCPGSSVRQRRFTPAQPLELVSSSDALGQPYFRCRSLDHVFDGRIHNRLCTPASSRHIATSIYDLPASLSFPFVLMIAISILPLMSSPSGIPFVVVHPHDRWLDAAAWCCSSCGSLVRLLSCGAFVVGDFACRSFALDLASSSPRTAFSTLDDVWIRSYFRTRRVRSRRPVVGFVESAFRSVGLNVHVSVVVLDYCAASDECV